MALKVSEPSKQSQASILVIRRPRDKPKLLLRRWQRKGLPLRDCRRYEKVRQDWGFHSRQKVRFNIATGTQELVVRVRASTSQSEVLGTCGRTTLA